MSLFIAMAFGGLGSVFGRMGASAKTSAAKPPATGPGASTGSPLGLLLTLTQA